MRDSTRTIATLIIWVAMASLIGGLLTTSTGAISRANGATLFGIVLVLSIMGMVSTATIWLAGRGSAAESAETSRAKAKRQGRSRIERLIQDLDDDEIYDLEAMLLARDDDAHRSRGSGG